MDEKKKQTESAILKRKHDQAGKQKIDDTMLGFQSIILPGADGCHPNISVGTQSNKIDRFNSINPLRLDTSAENEDDVDENDDDNNVLDDEDGVQ